MQCDYLEKSLSIIVHNHPFTSFLSCHSSEILQPHLKRGIKPFSNLGRQPKAAGSLSEVSADLCFYLKALQTYTYNTLNVSFTHDKRILLQSHRLSLLLWVYFFSYLAAVEQLCKCCICGLVRPSNISGNETNGGKYIAEGCVAMAVNYISREV